MSEHIIPVLRTKRAEISGHILELEKRITRLRADLANIDAAIRILSPGMEPGAIPPKRAYKRTQYFARNELARMALDMMRKAQGPLAAREIAIAIMKAKGLAMGNDRLCATVTDMLLVALRSLAKRNAITKTGVSRNAQWAVTATLLRNGSYLRSVAIAAMDVFKLVPMAVNPVIITIAINPAIRPYSIAVAPFLSVANALMGYLILRSEDATREALRIANDQARAALLSAKNLLRTTRPLCILDAITLETFSGAVPSIKLPEGYYLKSIHGTIVNKGTAVAFAKEIQFASSVSDSAGAPLESEETGESSVFGYNELPAGEPYTPALSLYSIPLNKAVEEGAAKVFVWGWLRYADIHGIVRRSGFAFEWICFKYLAGGTLGPGRFKPCGPASHWYDIEERMPEAGGPEANAT